MAGAVAHDKGAVPTQQEQAQSPVIWWCRRDLRLDDNPALHAALQTGGPLVPVFVWAPEEEGQFQQGRYSRWWTKQTVALFQNVIEQLGSRLIIRRATDTAQGLMQVVRETGARAVFFNHLYDPISLVRDHEVKASLNKLGIDCRSFNADLLYEPWEVMDAPGQPFTCFEAFWNRVLEMPAPPPFPLPAPAALPAVDPELPSLGMQGVDWFMTPEQEASSDQLKFKWRPGVEGAVEKLEHFLGGQLHQFEHDRAKVDRHSTTSLSPWIHTGTISVRYIFYRVCQRQAELRLQGVDISRSCRDFLQQLGYREYSRYLSFHFPFIHERSLLAHLRACPWRMDQQHFKAWRQGQTGYPLVDAAMRELWATGWCHNRLRVVAASFMVKNLLLPWQWGLKHYWDAQMDADLECDALGWQYVSGGMTDAHPFNRLMDLETEALRFDPDGQYVRRWLPVLARLPTQYIHSPWTAPPQVLEAADVELGFNYPERIISGKESLANMEYACRVLESCASASGKGTSASHPYRPPTLPLSHGAGFGPSKGSGRGLGADGRCHTPALLADGRAPNSGSQPVQNYGSGPAVHHGMVRAGQAEEGVSAYVRPAGGAPRRRPPRPRAPATGLPGDRDGESDGDDGDGDAEVLQYAPAGEYGLPTMSSSYSEDEDMSEGGVSEEVVSNTVGASAPQASAWSRRPRGVGLPGEAGEDDDEAEISGGRGTAGLLPPAGGAPRAVRPPVAAAADDGIMDVECPPGAATREVMDVGPKPVLPALRLLATPACARTGTAAPSSDTGTNTPMAPGSINGTNGTAHAPYGSASDTGYAGSPSGSPHARLVVQGRGLGQGARTRLAKQGSPYPDGEPDADVRLGAAPEQCGEGDATHRHGHKRLRSVGDMEVVAAGADT